MDVVLPAAGCTGCGACEKLCSVHAISMEEKEDGFLYPVLAAGKCVSCGKCMRTCPALSQMEMHEPLQCFAAQSKDREQLQASSSGGLFPILAQEVLRQGGTVYGCAYDENYSASIIRAETPKDLIPMRGSKYVWSSTAESYRSVQDDLSSGREVLYTGLPCQIAGLKQYLGRDYPALFTVDLLCGGAPSPLAFREYLKTLAPQKEWSSLEFQFRDKDNHKTGVNCTYYRKGKKHHENYTQNSFYFAFSSKSRITWRESCYHCSYKSIQRVSDMTIGDYWGYSEHHHKMNPDDGVSVILIGTEQGKKLFERVRNALEYELSEYRFAIPKNSLVSSVEEGHIAVPKDRESFFRALREKGWKEAERKYLMTEQRKKLLLRSGRITGRILRFLNG